MIARALSLQQRLATAGATAVVAPRGRGIPTRHGATAAGVQNERVRKND